MLTKDQLPKKIVTKRTIIRRAVAEDLPKIAAWPRYGWPDDWADMTNELARGDDGVFWWEKIDRPDRCHYSVVLPTSGEIIGVQVCCDIDWAGRSVGNMGVRIHPNYCDKGYCSETLPELIAAVLDSDMKRVRLDVAACNHRALRCYEKCGMRQVEEFWREYKDGTIDPADPKWAPLLPYTRRDGE